MLVVSNHLEGIPLLHVLGEVDHGNAPTLGEAIETALAERCSHLLLDLESCPYMDSGGVSLLLEALRKVRAQDGWLGLIAPHPDVLRILSLVGLTVDPKVRTFSHTDEIVVGASARSDA